MNKPHHTWSDSPIHEQIRDAGLDPVNRTTNDTPTPETDKNEFPCMTWPSQDHPMVVRADFARKLERERDRLAKACDQYSEDEILCKLQTVTAQRDEAVNNYESAQLLAIRVGEHRDRLAEEVGQLKSRLTQPMGAVTISRNGYVRELEQQRDRLAEAVENIIRIYENPAKGCIPSSSDMYDEALQSLTPNAKP